MGVGYLVCHDCKCYLLLSRCCLWGPLDYERVRAFLCEHRTCRLEYRCSDYDGEPPPGYRSVDVEEDVEYLKWVVCERPRELGRLLEKRARARWPC